MIMERDANGNRLFRYVHGSNADADDPLIEFTTGSLSASNRRYLHADPRGSIVSRTDYRGHSIGINTYDEYGIPSASNEGRFQYTGQMWIPELGMYYYKPVLSACLAGSRRGPHLLPNPGPLPPDRPDRV